MSKDHKHQRASGSDYSEELKARISRTLGEEKYQQALDLAKQLHKAAPTPEHASLVKETYLKRAKQLRSQGHLKDAVNVLDGAMHFDPNNVEWMAKILAELSRLGMTQKSLHLLQQIETRGGRVDRDNLFACLADGSLVSEKHRREELPPEMQRDFDLIQKAFKASETGNDDEARTTLEAIGIRSPYREWKLLLRGLMAYYASDDARALENWIRLDPNRAPARITAPLRAKIDPAFASAQTPKTIQTLQNQFNWLQPDAISMHLRALEIGLSNRDSLDSALKAAEAILPEIRRRAPHLEDRLRRAFYAAIYRAGPKHLPRFQRIFGQMPDDKNCYRLISMGLNDSAQFAEAHETWQHYEKEIAQDPQRWPGEQGTMARALIWSQMGRNAAQVPSRGSLKKLPRYLRDFGKEFKPLSPSVEECYERSLSLAPNLLEAHEGLLSFYLNNKKTKQAIQAAENLLQSFPDHVPTLMILIALYREQKKFPQARERLEQAIRHDPLNRDLPKELGGVRLAEATELALRNRFEETEQHLQEAYRLLPTDQKPILLCREATIRMRAGDLGRADELVERARNLLPSELCLNYYLLAESYRVDLPNKLRTKWIRYFNKEIGTTPDVASALCLVKRAATLVLQGFEYYGQASHNKKILTYAGKTPHKNYSEEQLLELMSSMIALSATLRSLRSTYQYAQKSYPANPRFHFAYATFLMGDEPDEDVPFWEISQALDEAERLALKLRSTDPSMNELLEKIGDMKKSLKVVHPLLGGLGAFFDLFSGEDR